MTMNFGKAISGGRPLSDDELEGLAQEQLSALRDAFALKPEHDKTDDVLNLRLAEELRLVQRMLQMVEANLEARGNFEGAKAIDQAEHAIEDIAEVVEADDRCDAIDDVDEDIARRLTRRALDGSAAPCDNRPRDEKKSILRKAD